MALLEHLVIGPKKGGPRDLPFLNSLVGTHITLNPSESDGGGPLLWSSNRPTQKRAQLSKLQLGTLIKLRASNRTLQKLYKETRSQKLQL